MALRLQIETLTSASGDVVSLPPVGVTCVVGANNSGKSQLLRDIQALLTQPNPPKVTLAALSTALPMGTVDELEVFLKQSATIQPGERAAPPSFGAPQVAPNPLASIFGWVSSYSQGDKGTAPLAGPFFVRHTSAGTLAQYAVNAVSTSTPTNSTPLTKLVRNGPMEEELSAVAKATFGEGVVLDRLSLEMRLRVGETTVPVPPLNRPSIEYGDAIAALPSLDSQGDGFRSFMGMALHVLSDDRLLLLVDEPEVFLHPGQARALGRWVAKKVAERGMQVVVATHDRDFLLGLIEQVPSTPVNVLRISRNQEGAKLKQLPPAEVAAVWIDPVLRYSNILQGLFHDQVVVCEADADCRFFGAALDEMGIKRGLRAVSDNTLFVPSGGKDRVAQMAKSLSALGVKARAIVDFDALRVRSTIKGVMEAVGGFWTDEDAGDYVLMSDAINKMHPDFDQAWKLVKHQGLAALESGPAFDAGSRLLESLRQAGVLVVPFGEMEDFDKGIRGHGAPWVSDALAENLHKSAAVITFLKPLMEPPH